MLAGQHSPCTVLRYTAHSNHSKVTWVCVLWNVPTAETMVNKVVFKHFLCSTHWRLVQQFLTINNPFRCPSTDLHWWRPTGTWCLKTPISKCCLDLLALKHKNILRKCLSNYTNSSKKIKQTFMILMRQERFPLNLIIYVCVLMSIRLKNINISMCYHLLLCQWKETSS